MGRAILADFAPQCEDRLALVLESPFPLAGFHSVIRTLSPGLAKMTLFRFSSLELTPNPGSTLAVKDAIPISTPIDTLECNELWEALLRVWLGRIKLSVGQTLK